MLFSSGIKMPFHYSLDKWMKRNMGKPVVWRRGLYNDIQRIQGYSLKLTAPGVCTVTPSLERLKLNKTNPAAAIKQIPSFTARAMVEAVWLTALQRMLFVVDLCDG